MLNYKIPYKRISLSGTQGFSRRCQNQQQIKLLIINISKDTICQAEVHTKQ